MSAVLQAVHDCAAPVFAYCRGANKYDASPVLRTAPTFEALRDAVLADRSRVKGAQYICAPMRGEGGALHRGKDDALPRAWQPFDLDKAAPRLEAVAALNLYLCRFQGFGWFTHSHRPESPRLRVILALSREVTRDEGNIIGLTLEAAMRRAVAGLGQFDRSVYRSEQPVYCPPVGAESFRFEGEPVDVDEWLAGELPDDVVDADEGPGVSERAETIASTDPVVQVLQAREMVHKEIAPGKLAVICPFDDEHTSTTGDTSTVYYLPHFAGVKYGKFHCLHDHCSGRPQEDYLRALGLIPREVWREQQRDGTEGQPAVPAASLVLPREQLAIGIDELQAASLAPRCIVENYLHADVATLVSPGGVGKTTMQLHEIICITLGRPVWGMPVVSPGWVLFVTNEDPRERLAARLREIMRAMALSVAEQRQVLASFIPLDLTGMGVKLVSVRDGNIEPTSLAGELVQAYRDDPPALVVFDPLVSFGASEAMVNDNEQALINVARYLVREFGCCVRFIHHTGKQAARDSITDQYSGRGGSALPDGSRMVAVLATWDGKASLPAGCRAGDDVSIFRLERPKLSYAKPNQPTIWIRREGFAYEYFIEFPQSPDQAAAGRVSQLERYLEHCVKGIPAQYHTRRTLEDSAGSIGMTRAEIRSALATLEAQRRVVDAPVPPMLRRGGRKAFLCPADRAASFGEVEP